MTCCGICLTARHLVGVIVGPGTARHEGPAFTLRRSSTAARLDLIALLAVTDRPALVIEDATLRDDTIARLARTSGVSVWVAPAGLLHAIAQVAGLRAISPRRNAAVLARLPYTAATRSQLTRLSPLDPRQRPLPL